MKFRDKTYIYVRDIHEDYAVAFDGLTTTEIKERIINWESTLSEGEFIRFFDEGSYDDRDYRIRVYREESDEEYLKAKAKWDESFEKQKAQIAQGRERRRLRKEKEEYEKYLKLKEKYEGL